jgi:hypothetical protein
MERSAVKRLFLGNVFLQCFIRVGGPGLKSEAWATHSLQLHFDKTHALAWRL